MLKEGGPHARRPAQPQHSRVGIEPSVGDDDDDAQKGSRRTRRGRVFKSTVAVCLLAATGVTFTVAGAARVRSDFVASTYVCSMRPDVSRGGQPWRQRPNIGPTCPTAEVANSLASTWKAAHESVNPHVVYAASTCDTLRSWNSSCYLGG